MGIPMYSWNPLQTLVLLTVVLGSVAGATWEAPDRPTEKGAEDATQGPANGLRGHGVQCKAERFQKLPKEIVGLDLVAFGDGPKAYRVVACRDLAFVSTGLTPNGIIIFNISDPFAPTRVGFINTGGEMVYEALTVLDYGDRLVVGGGLAPANVGVMGVVNNLKDQSSGPAAFWDVTDPTAPVELARIPSLTHMLAPHPETYIVYASQGSRLRSQLGILVIDASDPDNIHLAKVFDPPAFAQDGSPIVERDALTCHGVTVDPIKDRLYCAAGTQTLIIDISRPLDPVVLTTIRQYGPAPNEFFCCDSTYAVPFLDGRYVAISAEAGDCVQMPSGTEWFPGRLWFFDVENLPAKFTGVVGIPATRTARPPCTVSPTEGSEVGVGTGMLAFGWEEAGLALIDATDPSKPRIASADFSGRVGRDAYYYRGLVFAAGEVGGLQVAVPVAGGAH